MPNRRLLALGLGMLVTGALGLAVLAVLDSAVTTTAPQRGVEVADGAAIFRRGVTASGERVRSAGSGMIVMSCAQCHGPDGRGRRHQMFVAPDIRYRNLSDPAGMVEPDGGRGPTFTEAQIRNAIVAGVDAEGKPLAWPMPRWQLTQQQLDSLIAYLKALP